jgi:hypothetical protein
MKMKTLLGLEIEATQVTFLQSLSTFCPCPDNWCKAKFEGDGLTDLMEKISMQHIICIVTWVLLVVFN